MSKPLSKKLKIKKGIPCGVNSFVRINCETVSNDAIFDANDFSEFLASKIKVGQNKAGKLNGAVEVVPSSTGSHVDIIARIPFPKRYAKYLTKKYLKANTLREYLRVVATSKNGFTLKYYAMGTDDAEEETAAEESQE